MPDWIGHIVIALVICLLFKINERSLVVLGALLPDLIQKLFLLFLVLKMPFDFVYWILVPTHLPAGLILSTFVITPFFNYKYRRTYFLITLGWVSHILADMLSKTFLHNAQLRLLFPISWESFAFNLLWGDEFWIITGMAALVYIALLMVKRTRKKP